MTNLDASFSGEPETVWLTEIGVPDRNMLLIEALSFTDRDGRVWHAPENTVIDGASIPRALWSLAGSPFTGDYRRASVVHDVAHRRAEGDKSARLAADKMFYRACRAGGCSIVQAVILYVGVRIGTLASQVPMWALARTQDESGPRIHLSATEARLQHDFVEIAEYVLAGQETDDADTLEARYQTAALAILKTTRDELRFG